MSVRRGRRQRGQVIVIFALVMALFLGGLLLGVARFSVAYHDYVVANEAAMEGVRSGASQLNMADLEGQVMPDGQVVPGTVVLSQPAAQQACAAAGNVVISDDLGGGSVGAGSGGTACSITQTNRLTATVSIVLPPFFGFGQMTVSATDSGCPVAGFGGVDAGEQGTGASC
jgi:hypothetical protein